MKKIILMATALVISASMFASTGHKGKAHAKKQTTTAQTAKEKPAPKEAKAKMHVKGKEKGTVKENKAAVKESKPKSEKE